MVVDSRIDVDDTAVVQRRFHVDRINTEGAIMLEM